MADTGAKTELFGQGEQGRVPTIVAVTIGTPLADNGEIDLHLFTGGGQNGRRCLEHHGAEVIPG